MAKATTGTNGAFVYDFGIMIAQSTVSKLERTVKSALSLATAYYALNKEATEYIGTLRETQIYFGGQVSALRAIADAQDRIIKGQSRFSVKDQMEGLKSLAAVGIDARKEMEWTEKAAHAMGVSYSQFSNAIANAVRGNMGGLVEMGLMTERATRQFAKYQGNTIMMQSAVLNFVKQHKGLQTMIKNDFETVKDQIIRIKTVWKSFLQSILGRPNDPQSFLGQVNLAFKEVAIGFANSADTIKMYGFQIGAVLGWLIRQVGHAVRWLGGQIKNVIQTVWKVGDDYQEAVYSTIVWLEFQKRAVIDFFNTYGKAIKNVLKLLLIFTVAKKALKIGASILAPLVGWLGKVAAAAGAATWATTKFGKVWWGLFSTLPAKARGFLSGLGAVMGRAGRLLRNPALFFRVLKMSFKALGGWVTVAITAVTILYTKSEKFRNFVTDLINVVIQGIRWIWNALVAMYAGIRLGAQKLFGGIKEKFSSVINWFSNLWGKFMNSKVGKALQKVVDFFRGGLARLGNWISGGADYLGSAAKEAAAAGGFSVKTWDTPFTSTTPYVPAPAASPELPSSPLPSWMDRDIREGDVLSLAPGAVQINLYGSEGIDENVLARKVEEVLDTVNRKKMLRGGK